MSGKHITDQQVRLYMEERKQGRAQKAAAARASLFERSARRIDKGELAAGLNRDLLLPATSRL